MSRQQKILLIALAGTLALVLVVILVLMLTPSGADQTLALSEMPTITATPQPTGPTAPPVSEQEMANQALFEEEDHDIVDEFDPEANATVEPID